MLNSQTAQAYGVLAVIYRLVPSQYLDRLLIQFYENGREHGFSLADVHCNTRVSFAENRNSDSIVVYNGFLAQFSPQGNTPSDVAYKDAIYFEPFRFEEAAKHVIEILGLDREEL